MRRSQTTTEPNDRVVQWGRKRKGGDMISACDRFIRKIRLAPCHSSPKRRDITTKGKKFETHRYHNSHVKLVKNFSYIVGAHSFTSADSSVNIFHSSCQSRCL